MMGFEPQEAQNVVPILCVVHFFVILPIKNNGAEGGGRNYQAFPFRRYSLLTLCMYFRVAV